MLRPPSNLQPESQPWGRSVDEYVESLRAEIEDLSSKVKLLAPPRDSTSSRFAEINYQISRIYGLIGSATATPTAPPPPTVTYSTIEIVADWSRSWGSSSFYTGGGTDTDGQALYQGSSPENKIGMWHFNAGPASGRNYTDVQMFLQNINSPYAAGFTANLATHANQNAPTGKPGRGTSFDVGWSRGEGKWIAIPSSMWGSIANGSIQGFTVGGAGPSNANYAYFQGVGKANPPRLKITYQN